jgi:hypothetical protein
MARRKPNRVCDRCGKIYYRASRMRLWTKTNPGHRDGWGKDDVRLCVSCMGSNAAKKAATLVSARIVSIDLRKKAS